MTSELPNRAAVDLLPPDLLAESIREALLESPLPALLIDREGGVMFASHAFARRLALPDGAVLLARGLPRLAPGTARLEALAGRLPEGVQAERLRFALPLKQVLLPVLVSALPLRDGGKALLVLLNEESGAAQAHSLPGIAAPAAEEASPFEEASPIEEAPAREAPSAVAEPTAPVEAPAPVVEAPSLARPRRFVFTLNRDGVIETLSPSFAAALSLPPEVIEGQALAEVAGALDAQAGRTIEAAVAAGRTFGGLRLLWPLPEEGRRVPVLLSAMPLMSAQGLQGFSGFGRVLTEDVAEQVAPAPQANTTEPLAQDALPAPAAEPQPEPEAAPAPADDLARVLAALQEEEAAEQAAPAVTPETQGREAPNVVELRPGALDLPPGLPPHLTRPGLSMSERNAFREIAKALGAKFDPDGTGETEAQEAPVASEPPLPPATPLPPEAPVASEALADGSNAQSVLDFSAPALLAPAPPLLVDSLPIGVLVLQGEATAFVNRTLLALTGYATPEALEAAGGAGALFRKGARPRGSDATEAVVLTHQDGEMIPVDALVQGISWKGTPATLMSFRRAQEIEQGRALASVALDLKRARQETGELRAILDTATDGVLTLDEQGAILGLNHAAEALFGLSQNEVAGSSFIQLLHNDSHASALDYFEGIKANGVKSVLNDGREAWGREKKGGRMPLFLTFGRISEGEPRRFCAVLRDLTAWKRAESELTEARRAAENASAKKSDFLAKVGHEIRTPMNAIIGFSEVMLEERLGPVENPKYKEYLGDIRASGLHVVSLVNDLLDLSKIEAGRMELHFAATDLNAIVGHCVGLIQPQATQHRVLVRSQLAPKLPPVVADERSIRQILLNLLSNATRFTPAGGQVLVATTLQDSGEAIIRIRDTGVGMSAVEIEQALESYRQVGTSRENGGTGLGLPLSKALAEANRANFAIRSAPGEGTTVEISFPPTRVLAE